MTIKIGLKFKRRTTPISWGKYQIIGKNEKGWFRVKDLADDSVYIEPFLDERFCIPITGN